MNTLTVIVLAWLTLLTALNAIGIALFVGVRRQLGRRLTDLDMRDQLHFVVQKLDRQAIHKDRELREAIEQLIARLEANPLTRDVHFVDIAAIKDKLRQ